MSHQLAVLGGCAAITAAIQGLGFLAAFAIGTEKFYDVLGGGNFLVLAVFSAYAGQGDSSSSSSSWADDPRKVTATAVFLASRCWLLIFLAWRAHERGGDSRFDEVKDKFWLFLLYWTVQGVWVWSISMPVVFINGAATAESSGDFTTFDWATIVGFASGVFFGKILVLSIASFRWLIVFVSVLHSHPRRHLG